MSSSSITIGSNTYTLVAIPSLGFSAIQLDMNDTVAIVPNPFTAQQQTQQWPGADYWTATVSLPPMQRVDVAPWRAFLAQLQGSANVFQLGDPLAPIPLGTGSGSPVVNMSGGSNAPMTTTLYTSGWTANAQGVLLPDDYIQVGYRLHKVLDTVNASSSGDAAIAIWPSIRDTLTQGQQIILSNPMGLFRLADNKRSSHSSPAQLTTISFNAVEAR